MRKYIVATIFFFTVLLTLFWYKVSENEKPIERITQLSTQKEALSSLFLTELLGLSFDKKSYRESFDMDQAKKNLLSSSLILDASISFIDNSHIKVTYVPVTPIALIGDFENCAVDMEGNLFQLKPFFAKDGLPKLYFGIKGARITNLKGGDLEEKWLFAKKCLLALLQLSLEGKIVSIDVSKILEKSLGKNEVVVVIQHLNRKDYLRLTKRNYLNEMSNYIILCDKIKDESGTFMVDMRFEQTAFLEKFEKQ